MESTPIAAWTYLLALVLLTEYGIKQWFESSLRNDVHPSLRTYALFRAGHFFVNLAGGALIAGLDSRLLITLTVVEIMGAVDLPLAVFNRTVYERFGVHFRWLHILPMASLALWVASETQSMTLSPLMARGLESVGQIITGAEAVPSMLGATLLGFVVLAHPANHIVRAFVAKHSDRQWVDMILNRSDGFRWSQVELAATHDPQAHPDHDTKARLGDSSTLRAGRTIGTLERWIMFALILVDQFSLIGLVLTAKSIARFKRFEQDPDFVEYYLLGTLYSTFLALAVGMVATHV